MLGYLDGVAGLRTLFGWAADDQGQPPELTAYVNGVARLVFTPSIERPDLLPLLGRSDLGFVVDFGIPLKIGDWVAVAAGDGSQLQGSPMEVTRLDGTREDKALALVNREMTILEIGPSFRPIACRSAGWRSYSLDHASQEELREKYRGSHPIENIKPVDFIWRSGALEDTVPPEFHGTFDVVIASHVIEHFPDPVGFYLSAAMILKAGGLVSLVVPDKRLTFDFFKPVSVTSDLLNVHAQGRTRHSRKTAFDNLAYNVFEHGDMSWSWRPVDQFTFPAGNTALEQAKQIFDSTVEDESAPYVDFHHTVHTPSSFALNILELGQLGVIPFTIAQSYPTSDCEFFVTLRKGPVEKLAPEELSAERLRLLKGMIREQAEQARWMESDERG